MVFGRKGSSEAAGTAVAEASPEVAEARELAKGGDVDAAIGLLTDLNRGERRLELEREIRRLRHLAGVGLVTEAGKNPSYAKPGGEVPEPGPQSRIPELTPDQLTPAVLRASILQYGCLLVRGLMDRDAAERMASGIDRAFEIRERLADGESD